MRSFIILLCLIPTLLFARQSQLKTLLEQAIKGKKAEIGIAVIIDGKDTVTVNNDIQYPLMSVFKFHQAVALADYMDKKRLPPGTLLSIKKSDLKPNTYSPLRDQFPQGGFEMSIADLLKYTLQQSDNNACDILFNYQGGPDSVNRYIHSLGIRDCAIAQYGERYARRLRACVINNWSYSAGRGQITWKYSVKKHCSHEAYKDFIYQTMVECQTGQDRLVAPLLGKGVTVGHKTGTGDFNAKGQQIGCNDIGFVLLPNGHAYSIAVFVKDSAESSLENSKIIAEISRIVYKYVIRTTK